MGTDLWDRDNRRLMIFKEVSNKSMNKVAIDKLFLKNGYIN